MSLLQFTSFFNYRKATAQLMIGTGIFTGVTGMTNFLNIPFLSFECDDESQITNGSYMILMGVALAYFGTISMPKSNGTQIQKIETKQQNEVDQSTTPYNSDTDCSNHGSNNGGIWV